MNKLVVGCLVVLGVGLVAVAGVVLAGYYIYSRAASASAERDRLVLEHHFSPVARSPRLPERGTQIILSGTHPIAAAENGHETGDAVSGHFFMDLDNPELTLVEQTDAATRPRVARTIRGFTSDFEIYEDGTVGTTDFPDERAKALLHVKARRSPDATRFAWVDETRKALVLADAAGAHERAVATGLPRGSYDVYWSFDSRRLFVYVYDDDSYRTGNPPAKNAIYQTPVDAPKLTKVWEEAEASKYYLGPMIHVPTRDALVFVRNNRLEMIDVAAKKDGVFWEPSDATTSVSYPSLSPDGTKVGTLYDGKLCLIDAASGRLLSKIAADDDPSRRYVTAFFFAPHDRMLYYATSPDDHVGEVDYVKWTSWNVTNHLLYVVNADGSGRRQLSDNNIELSVDDVYEH